MVLAAAAAAAAADDDDNDAAFLSLSEAVCGRATDEEELCTRYAGRSSSHQRRIRHVFSHC